MRTKEQKLPVSGVDEKPRLLIQMSPQSMNQKGCSTRAERLAFPIA